MSFLCLFFLGCLIWIEIVMFVLLIVWCWWDCWLFCWFLMVFTRIFVSIWMIDGLSEGIRFGIMVIVWCSVWFGLDVSDGEILCWLVVIWCWCNYINSYLMVNDLNLRKRPCFCDWIGVLLFLVNLGLKGLFAALFWEIWCRGYVYCFWSTCDQLIALIMYSDFKSFVMVHFNSLLNLYWATVLTFVYFSDVWCTVNVLQFWFVEMKKCNSWKWIFSRNYLCLIACWANPECLSPDI